MFIMLPMWCIKMNTKLNDWLLCLPK